eukprot:gene17250-18974_t
MSGGVAKRSTGTPKLKERLINSPPLLNGETILVEAETVLKFNSMSKRGSGIMGNLYITNFKLAFMITKLEKSPTPSQKTIQSSTRQLDDLLADEESRSECDYIPLTSISYITAISTGKQVSKKLRAGKIPSKKYDTIELTCKDLRVAQFDLSHCKENDRAKVINTIFVYAFPTNVQKLFAFDYARDMHTNAKASAKGRAFHTFRHEKDLELELARLRAQQNWRVCKINQGFSLCKTLPELIKVPAILNDDNITSISDCYNDGRVPTLAWCSRETGAALLSSSAPRNEEEDSCGHSQQMIDAIQKSCPTHKKRPVTVDATLIFPALKELQSSYIQLFDACLCHSYKDFWTSDSSWLGKVDNSRWLEYIKTALTAASDISKWILMDHTSVIIHDATGRDYACLLVSLIQIMADPYYRTVVGLQSLIQKEWVTKGHPFSLRFSLASSSQKINRNKLTKEEFSNMTEASPVFILFLDCIHQLWTQFPSQFGYTEHFLLLLIDSVYMCLFETFLFDSESERHKHTSMNLESIWDFLATKIPPTKFKTLFLNPLYDIESNWEEDRKVSIETEAQFIYPDTGAYFFNDCAAAKNVLPGQNKKTSKDKLSNITHSVSMQYKSNNDPNIVVVNPDASGINIQLWHKYFLRWTPTVDLCKGSSREVSQHLQQVELLGELRYLEDRREYLKDKLDGLENPSSDVESTASSQGSIKMKKARHVDEAVRPIEKSYVELLSKFTFCSLISSD